MRPWRPSQTHSHIGIFTYQILNRKQLFTNKPKSNPVITVVSFFNIHLFDEETLYFYVIKHILGYS